MQLVWHMKRRNQTESPIFVICVFFVFKGNPFLLLFFSTVGSDGACGGRKKSPSTYSHNHSAAYIILTLGSLSPSWLF